MKIKILKTVLVSFLIIFSSIFLISCNENKKSDIQIQYENIQGKLKEFEKLIEETQEIQKDKNYKILKNNKKNDVEKLLIDSNLLKNDTEENIINKLDEYYEKLKQKLEEIKKLIKSTNKSNNNSTNKKNKEDKESPKKDKEEKLPEGKEKEEGNDIQNDDDSSDINIEKENKENEKDQDINKDEEEQDEKEEKNEEESQPKVDDEKEKKQNDDSSSNSDQNINSNNGQNDIVYPDNSTDEAKYYYERQLFKPTITLKPIKHGSQVYDDLEYVYNRESQEIRKYARTLRLNQKTKHFKGYDGYYDKMNGVSLNNYLPTLTQILSTNIKYGGYNSSANVFKKADVVVKNGNKYYYGMYDSKLYPLSSIFDREHVWPNARLGVERIGGEEKGVASDYYNLRFSNRSLNRRKKDKYFADGKGEAPIVYTKKTKKVGFYPGSTQKGDVARILLYMAVKYPHLKLVFTPEPNKTYTSQNSSIGDARLLLKWHKEDPVDDFERKRNEEVYKVQKNRNPFVDHPDIFEKALKIKLLTQKITSQKNLKPDYKDKKISTLNTKYIFEIKEKTKEETI